MAINSLLRLAWRHAWRRPLQSLFLIVGVAIGVAMIVAIDLANGSAERAFQLGAETVTGKATHQISGGPSGLDEAVYTQLRLGEGGPGYRESAPVVESYVVAQEMDAQPVRLLGVDSFAEPPFRSYIGPGDQSQAPAGQFLRDLMVTPNTALISTAVAERYGLRVGDRLNIRNGMDKQTLTIAGLLQPSDDLARALDGLVIVDIATAQEVLGMVGKLSRIDLIIPLGQAGATALAQIRSMLPANARVDTTASRTGAVSDMTAAFSLNLTALSLLALVVGMFLIYNTVTFSVIQRRAMLGALRALGMTRREIFAMILVEAGILGLIGTVLGLGLGVVLGRGAVQMVTQTVNDLFFVVAVREIDVPLLTLVKDTAIGVAAALIGAAVPAWEATSVPPTGAMRRSSVEERTRKLLPVISVFALVMLGVGIVLLIPPWNLVITFGGLFAIVIGAALLTPIVTLWLMDGVQRLLRGRSGVIERMAPRTIVRSLSRIAVAVAALMVAVSVIIGVGVMIGSFRQTVELWLQDVLQADIFVSSPALGSGSLHAELTPDLLRQLQALPGVAAAATTRDSEVAAQVGADSPPVQLRLVALSQDLAGADRRYRSALGDWQQTWSAVEQGSILINEPMAHRLGLKVGDNVIIQTDRGPKDFSIAGVTVDFDARNVAFMTDANYRKAWDDRGISAIALFVTPGVDVDAKVNEIRARFAGKEELLVRSNRGTRQNALEVFDRTFSITVALQLLATVVAFIGILSTLMSLQMERMREIGVLRSTGMTRRQLWKLSLLETGLVGSTAGLLAMPTGFVLAVILIYIINLRSFGWTLEMRLQPMEFVQAFVVALVAALLAGLYPAWKMGQTQPAEALRSE